MTTFSSSDPGTILAAALRERASDLGDEEHFVAQVIAAAVVMPQQRRSLHRPATWTAKRLLLVAALVGTGVLAVFAGGTNIRREPSEPSVIRNGPLLVSGDSGTFWVDAVTGRRLAEEPWTLPRLVQAAAWSRDGRSLAVAVAGDLEVLDAATGDRRIVASCAAIGWVCDWRLRTRPLEWSPDGATIAIAEASGVVLVDVATGAVTTLVRRTPGDELAPILSNPTWSPDGAWIAYEADDTRLTGLGMIRQLHIVRVDGSEAHRLLVPMRADSLGLTQPVWPASGPGILVPASDGSAAEPSRPSTLTIAAIPIDDGEVAGPVIDLVRLGEVPCATCVTFTYSPDGLSVILDDGESWWIADLDREGIRRIDERLETVLAWQPLP